MLLLFRIFRFDVLFALDDKSKFQAVILCKGFDQLFRQNNATMIFNDAKNTSSIADAVFYELDFTQILFQFEVDHKFVGIDFAAQKIDNEKYVGIVFMAHVEKDKFLVERID